MDDILTVKALGQTALIGSLYDARKQRFINDVRLFNFNKLPTSMIQKISSSNSFFKVCTDDTYSKKLELLNISGDLGVKVVCLPLEVKGAAKFINEFKKSERSVKWNLLYSRTTINETINLEEIYDHYRTQKLHLNDALFEGATHVVTGINWGSNAVMSVEYENHRNEPKKAIERMLSSQFEKLKLIESTGSFDGNFKPYEQLKEAFKCEIKADIPDLDGTFNSLEEAEASFKNIPKVIKDYGKGVQLEFHLSSLERIKKIFRMNEKLECEKIFNEVDDEFYDCIHEALQNIVLFKQKHHNERDLVKNVERDETNLKKKFFKQFVYFRSNEDRSGVIFETVESVLKELEAIGDCEENEAAYKAVPVRAKKYDEPDGEQSVALGEKLKELVKMGENMNCEKMALIKDDLVMRMHNMITCSNKPVLDPNDKDFFQNLEAQERVLTKKLAHKIYVYKHNKSIFNPIDLDELKKLKSECANLYFKKGFALHNMNRQLEAIQCFNQVIALNANYINAYNNKGNALQSLNKFNEAIKCYNEAIEIDPEYADAYYNKGNALSNLYKYRQAIACYDKAIQYNPNYAHAYNNKGNALRKLNEYGEAINCYNKSLEINPNNILAINNKKLALEELRKNKNVEVLTDADTLFNKGNSLFNVNNFTEAIEFYNKVLEINPDYTYAYAFKGIALDNLKKYEEAIECYDKVIELDPNDSDAYFNKGNSLYDLKRYEEAIDCYDKVIELDPKDAFAYNNKGNALRKLNRPTEAIHCYDKTIELNPNHALAHSNKNLALEEIIREIIKNKESDIERV